MILYHNMYFISFKQDLIILSKLTVRHSESGIKLLFDQVEKKYNRLVIEMFKLKINFLTFTETAKSPYCLLL